MSRKYTRVEQRRYKAEKIRQADVVAKRLLGRKPSPPPISLGEIFGGSLINYSFGWSMYQRPSTWSIISRMDGV